MPKSRVLVTVLFIAMLSLLLPACSSGLADLSNLSDQGKEAKEDYEKTYEDAMEQAGNAACQANLLSLKTALSAYEAENADYASSLQQLVDVGYLEKVPTCPQSSESGKQYNYGSGTGNVTCPNGHQVPGSSDEL